MSTPIRSLVVAVVALLVLAALMIGGVSKAIKNSINDDLEHRLSQAAPYVRVLDSSPTAKSSLGSNGDALIGKAAVEEFLASVRVVGYYSAHRNLPTSLEEAAAKPQPPVLDPWRNPLRLAPHGTTQFFIISGGPAGDAHLTREDTDSLGSQPTGNVYQLHGRIVFSGQLPKIPNH